MINHRAPFQGWETSYILSNVIKPSTLKATIDTIDRLQIGLFLETDLHHVQDIVVIRYHDLIGKIVMRAAELT